jgi:hypothetical protein
VYDFPKGERHGEAHRHTALCDATGDFVAHIADDDLWFPDHLKELGAHLSEVEFGNLFQVSAGRDGTLHPYVDDLADPSARRRMLEQRWNFFGPTVAGYRLSTYRRLPQGWASAPSGVWCDLHMWRKFLRLASISVGTRFSIQSITLENAGRQGMSLEERRRESEQWFKVVTTPEFRTVHTIRCWASVAKLLTSTRARAQANEDQIGSLRTKVARLELQMAGLAGALSELSPLREARPASPHNPVFVEQLYLDANPDVSDAIRNGTLQSGLDHWLIHGRREGRLLRPWTKVDIINHLADRYDYQTYLEICTPMTSNRFAEVDRSKYKTCHRLMYRCPRDFDDGMNIDFRTDQSDIGDCVRQIQSGTLRYDAVLVDSYREYAPSLRDLEIAWAVSSSEGIIIVHQCNPTSEELASPTYLPAAWSGVTYKAYLDFVTSRGDLEYLTVDTDEGCGVIWRKGERDWLLQRTAGQVDQATELVDKWREVGNDFQSSFRLLQQNKAELLRLLSVKEFLRTGALVAKTDTHHTKLSAN